MATNDPYKETKKAFEKFAKLVVIRADAQLQLKKINYTGRLSKSLDYEMGEDRGNLTASFIMEDYGQFVDEGRKPGKGAPPDKILEWVLKKPIKIRDSKGKFTQATQKQKESIAFLINRKIKEKGIEPTWFFTKQFDTYFKKLPSQLERALAKDIENSLADKK